MSENKPFAVWCVSLYTTCPYCQEEFDLFDTDGFIDGIKFEVAETDTPATTNVEVTCPACEKDFKVDFIY